MVFAAVWLVSGRHFWILPNIASDEIPINEVFSPMWMFDDLDASGKVVGKIGLVQRILGTGDFKRHVGDVGYIKLPRRRRRR